MILKMITLAKISSSPCSTVLKLILILLTVFWQNLISVLLK